LEAEYELHSEVFKGIGLSALEVLFLTPEDEVKEQLTKWLIENGCRVYWEKKNKNNHPIFKTKYVHKPDLLVLGKFNTAAVEVKTGDSKSNIYNGVVDCFDYWIHYLNQQKYFINSTEIYIHNFVVATENSINGHLYNDNFESCLVTEKFNDTRQHAINNGELPRVEFNMTEQSTRILWRLANRYSGNTIGIGVLLSNGLDLNPNKSPMLLVKQGRVQLWMSP